MAFPRAAGMALRRGHIVRPGSTLPAGVKPGGLAPITRVGIRPARTCRGTLCAPAPTLWGKCLVSRPATVLVAEDDARSRQTMVRLLERSGFGVVVAEDGAEALRLLSPEVQVALLDWMMPEVDGLSLCRLIKSSPETASVYVIMVTSRTEKSDLVAALDAGADDYMTKPVDHTELLARVRAGERIAQRERLLSTACEQERGRADRDALTGLYNRSYFDAALAREVAAAIARGGPLALLMLDLDKFKLVNDRYGHQVGDEVLRAVGRVLREQVRRGADIAARFGGEELAVIAPGTNLLCAMRLGERIRRQVALLRIPVGDTLISVTVSVGLAALNDRAARSEDPVSTLIEEADMRLYQAKHAGRNCVAA